MATSDGRAYVWTFLPGATEPVVAGAVFPSTAREGLAFQYANSYLARADRLSLGPDLGFDGGPVYGPALGHGMPSSIRDAMPDSWGRQVINREAGADLETTLPDIWYMLESGSDRVGAIDFQARPDDYVPRVGGGSLEAVAETAAEIVVGEPVGPELRRAIRNTLTAAGGSQPKAFVHLDGRAWLAKFSTAYDSESPLIKAERAALHIARQAGLDVPDARLIEVRDRGLALLTERFDRIGQTRRMVLSGMTIAGEYRASRGSYPMLVERLAPLVASPSDAGAELFRRLAFRIAMRIDDDHLRNIAVYWDGSNAAFTPAFDLSPDLVAEPIGLSDIGDGSREFSLAALVDRHRYYRLGRAQAREIAEQMTDAVREHREDAAEVAHMLDSEKRLLLARTATPDLIGPI